VDLATALQVSCDSYFYTMGKRLGIDAIADTGKHFGFGRVSGIDLAHEKAGIVPSSEWSATVRKHPWYAGETISVAIGQGPVLVSVLQQARALCGIANADGALPTPHLFHIGENVRSGERFVYRPAVKESVAWTGLPRDVVLDGLWRVVNQPGGTAYGSRVAGLDLCGKTGSVQVVGQKEAKKGHLLPEQLRDHGWFIGFAPKDDAQIVVAVFAEHGEHGSSAAAPLAAKMADYWVTKRRAGPPPVVAQAGSAAPRGAN
jgi:penicillin-binding protein 2